ncbi:cytochrome c oxidase biogenesis protein Cmc1 like-domain-containing protein [Daldinia decipiens]|uniref:cytochrome c oxidase biogenesis protein Cmc1 like-domain-containing protein n=1 Tax=Daldinia decipiens TaxID=326647 RepID=UPI0020C32B6D|nr:cytochrome c oxidase biogenesis protein Cmc1 like-domain-containing protein [Daldinia decipiens]KAI1657729.1 cytochrome c oxidase biogenesis protein Cmc1 like-domain-containing protein [Daldinia decipiens]
MAAAMAAQQPPIAPGGSSSRSTGNNNRGTEDISLSVPSRNPLPLSASQEAQVREVFNQRVRDQCADEIKAFADCARSRTLTIAFACRDASRRMNGCMLTHATPEEHDRAREQWFAQRQQRAREREQKERRKLEQEAFHREWWGLPRRDPEDVKKELEKLGRAERIGGQTRRRPAGEEEGEGRR